ncbi:MAG: protein kinase, partial [Polyangiaceae bacterium]|nr:protein kinase [Polyangiaceae bacterium]
MEFVDGANLKAIVEHLKKTGRDFPVEAAVYLALEVCKGLTYAHELTDSSGVPLHVVHRDVSPPNVLVTKFGEVKIVDFGLAKANSQLEKSEPGIIKGKFSYLSPEAAMGQDVDARTDIFAVGIILWELLAGQRLFLGETDFQTVKKVQVAQIPSISQINKRVPQELERIVVRALARDPAQRYPTARSLGQDLSKFLFRYGVPVSTFDLENLVQGAMRERQRYRPHQATIIDKLIEEALLEFTSLTDDKGQPAAVAVLGGGRVPDAYPQPGTPAAKGVPGGYTDMGKWLEEISVSQRRLPIDEPSRSAVPLRVTEGNLAALEDEPSVPVFPRSASSARPVAQASPSSAVLPAPYPSTASMLPAPQSSAAPLPLSVAPLISELPPRRPVGARFGMVIVVIVAVVGAAAWFANLISH